MKFPNSVQYISSRSQCYEKTCQFSVPFVLNDHIALGLGKVGNS